MSEPISCQCTKCLCWRSTRDKSKICRNCSEGHHEGDWRE